MSGARPDAASTTAGGVCPTETEGLYGVGLILEPQRNLGWKGAQAWRSSGSAISQGQASSI